MIKKKLYNQFILWFIFVYLQTYWGIVFCYNFLNRRSEIFFFFNFKYCLQNFCCLKEWNKAKYLFKKWFKITKLKGLVVFSLIKADSRKTRLLDAYDLQRFLSDYRDLTSWINSMMTLVSSDELAKDVTGAEALLERHQVWFSTPTFW